MKILLRKFDDEYYVWKPAKWEDDHYYIINADEWFGDMQIDMVHILAVSEDDRANYVRCKHCGALIENTPEAIERHFAAKEAEKDCLKCNHLRPYGNKKNSNTTYVLNADGTYSISEAYVSKLGCNISYYTEDINSAAAQRNCIYSRCRRSGVKPIDDVFVKYPNPFNKQLTIDFLDKKKFVCEGHRNGYYEYDLKLRDTLKACVNEQGVVDHFRVSIRGWSWHLYYSDTHNKIFYSNYGTYNDNCCEIMSEAKVNQIIAKLSKIYEEAEVDE